MFKTSKDKLIAHLSQSLEVERRRNDELADQVRVLTDRLVLLTDKNAFYATSEVAKQEYDPSLYYGGGQDAYEEFDDLGQKILVDRPGINGPAFPSKEVSDETKGAI